MKKRANVSQSRYEQSVAELRDAVTQQTRGQFTIGDRALEIEPVRQGDGLPERSPAMPDQGSAPGTVLQLRTASQGGNALTPEAGTAHNCDLWDAAATS